MAPLPDHGSCTNSIQQYEQCQIRIDNDSAGGGFSSTVWDVMRVTYFAHISKAYDFNGWLWMACF
jgi:hypothetical protein